MLQQANVENVIIIIRLCIARVSILTHLLLQSYIGGR